MRRITFALAAAFLGGCGGEFIITAPDVAVLAGEDAPVVVRLQRREFWVVAPPAEGACVMIRLGEDVLRSARTDKAGYVAASIDVPSQVGRYEVQICHQDAEGDVALGRAFVYVLQPDVPIVVVDMDSLPRSGPDVAEARGAIQRIQDGAQVIYAARKHPGLCRCGHEAISPAGYPDAPVVLWKKPGPWYRKWSRRQAGPETFSALRRRFPLLRWGLTNDAALAEAFNAAALQVLLIGPTPVKIDDAERFDSWADLKKLASSGVALRSGDSLRSTR